MPRTTTEPEFESLLGFLRDERGFDFTGYKRASLMRRVLARMSAVGVDDFRQYHACLLSNPGEFTQLFNTVLINVTDFFRDPAAWEVLARDFLPRIVEQAGENRPIRVWSAGCATGQEAYTLVMLLAEALGTDRFERLVKVYATDMDEEALARARSAHYSEREMESVPKAMRERYFRPVANQWVFRQDLRRQVIFGRHDLTRDAPISHLDLLVCRNLLMYFTTDTQTRILTRFHFAMREDAVLFLGRAEMMRSHASLFTPADLKVRIFSKMPRGSVRDRMLSLARPEGYSVDGRGAESGQMRIHAATLNAIPVAAVAVDAARTLVLANQPARTLFGLSPADVGRQIQDLTFSYRPVELRSRIDTVFAERRPLHLSNVEWPVPEGDLRHLDVDLAPLLDEGGTMVGVGISFTDVTRYQRLQAELVDAGQELETAFEELQSTNEELETTNEELQSTIEELETTNEELQSTNEELETMNEELQSTNEELETINLELSARTGELNQLNAYMASILSSLHVGVVVLDEEMYIRVWNEHAEGLWGLREAEVLGKPLQNLDIGLPVERLKAPIGACISDGDEHQELVLDAVNRRGRTIQCRITCTPFVGSAHEVRGAVLLMEEWGRDPAASLRPI